MDVITISDSSDSNSSRCKEPRQPSPPFRYIGDHPPPPVCPGIPHSTSSTSSDSEDSSTILEDATIYSDNDVENEDQENGEYEYDYADAYRFTKVAGSHEARENTDSSSNTLEDDTSSSSLHSGNNGENKGEDGERKEEEEFEFEEEEFEELYAWFTDINAEKFIKDYEHLFEAQEKDLYKMFCKERIFHPRSAITEHSTRFVNEESSSPFVGQDDEVEEKFQNFLSDVTSEGSDADRYLRFSNEDNQITVALSMEEIRDLDNKRAFMATAQQIDTYLHFRLKRFPGEIQQRVYRCSAYMLSINLNNINLNEWENAAPLRILEDALESEMKEIDFNIVPLLYEMHWTLAIVCGLAKQKYAELPGVPYETPCVLHFNSSKAAGIKCCHAYAIAKAVAKKANIDSNQVGWYQIASPQQRNGLDCGFYVMRFAVEFLKNINLTQPEPVHDFFHCLKDSFSYAKGKMRKTITKVPKWPRLQLKGFLVSINKDDRDWMTEFSEGRPCTIPILRYCIPKEIIEKNENAKEYLVQMLNKERPVSVTHEELEKYWNDSWSQVYLNYVNRFG